MNEIEITVTGNVCSDVVQREVAPGRLVTRFSVATAPRYFKDGQWTDGPTSFYNVACFGTLGSNVFASVHRGEPVLLRGRLRVRNWESDGVRRTSVDVEADTVGLDLRRGAAVLQRQARVAEPTDDPWAGVDPTLAEDARAAGLSPERAQADAAAVAASGAGDPVGALRGAPTGSPGLGRREPAGFTDTISDRG
jgi:single-strand DNA-binding protein